MKRRLMSFAVMFTLILPSVFAQSNDVWKPGTVEPSTSEISPLREIPPSVVQVLYNNGPIVTHPGGGAGGADASALQTALGMGTYGFGHAVSSGFRVADDFTVP